MNQSTDFITVDENIAVQYEEILFPFYVRDYTTPLIINDGKTFMPFPSLDIPIKNYTISEYCEELPG